MSVYRIDQTSETDDKEDGDRDDDSRLTDFVDDYVALIRDRHCDVQCFLFRSTEFCEQRRDPEHPPQM
ncbi:hypothetical protein HZ326_25955 [Fusarium oxysporum f. sp. albedinis]|nr:hypothetical protein HZ326_25955 [Fusarium oxysporum f. sp. albedinis]